MKLLFALLVFLGGIVGQAASTNTEFYVQTTGSNLNSGSTTNDNATYTSTNGNWNGTAIFTPVDGSSPDATVSVGDFASVYLDAATVAVYVARVTTVAAGVNGAITLSTTAKSGTAPTTGATGRSIKVGGAWKGPNAAVGFPFAFAAGTMVNAATNKVRVNVKAGVTYAVTAGLLHGVNGPLKFQGYTTTPGDGGRATIDGGTTGVSYALFNPSCQYVDFEDFIFAHNGLTSTARDGIIFSSSGAFVTFRRIVTFGMTAIGFNVTSGSSACVVEGESYGNGGGGFGNSTIANNSFFRCIAHDNTGVGFAMTGGTLVNCIADSNTGAGFTSGGTTGFNLIGCDAYNNGSHGLDLTGTAVNAVTIENCNFIKNGGWGISSSGALYRNGYIINCGFGSGSQVNTSGAIAATAARLAESGTITYASGVTPWADPAAGDFRIYLLAAKNTGRGLFLQTAPSYAGTISYPDVGAAFHYAPLSGGSLTFAQ